MSLLTKTGKIGSLELKNRMLMAPMGTHNGNMDRGTLEYFKARIDGGVSMAFCNMMISDKFEDTSASIYLTDENTPVFGEMCHYAHQKGSKICAQLMPGCGRTGGPSPWYGVPISASACSWLYAPNVPCHELTLEEIGILLDDYRSMAKRVIRAGADAIEIHAYGGYLTDQFLTAGWNTRKDEYGGSVEGRMKFLLDMVTITKEEGGADYPVIVKYSPCHYLPESYGFRGMAEGIEMAKIMEHAGVDALHIDAGCYENWYYAMPPIYFQEMTPQITSARTIKEAVGIPVITHGRLGDAAKAEAVLRDKICDFVAIGRGLLADPDIPVKVIENRTEDIRPCIGCNEGCIAQVCVGNPIRCAVNPFCAKEAERKPLKAGSRKRILVVGAGPGGCAAALLARKAGHDVELWEKQSKIGGRVLAAAAPYMKKDMYSLVEYYQTQLIKEGVRIRLMKYADESSVKEFAPDAVIWAAGGSPLKPASIPGLDRKNVCTAEDALRNLAIIGTEVVIAGGGLVGIEAALHFYKMGRHVTVIEMAETVLPKPPFAMNKMQLEMMLGALDIKVMTNTKLAEVGESSVIVETTEGRKEIPCDTVIMALGTKPTCQAAVGVDAGCPVICIGETVHGASDIMTSVEDAWNAAAEL